MAYSLYLVPSIVTGWEATWYALSEAEVEEGHYPDKIPEESARRMAKNHMIFYHGRPAWHIESMVRSADSKPVFYPHNPVYF